MQDGNVDILKARKFANVCIPVHDLTATNDNSKFEQIIRIIRLQELGPKYNSGDSRLDLQAMLKES